MSNAVKTIGVLTSGGDAPGMNAAIRAVVRTGISNEKRNQNGLLIIIGDKKYMVEKKEFFLALLSAADVFYQYLEQCDVSVLERKNKIREIRKKLI